MSMSKRMGVGAVALTIGMSGSLFADDLIMMPDSVNDRVVLFDAEDGALVDPMYIDLEPHDSATPNHAIVVGDEIWVSDQLRDKITRFDIEDQSFIGQIDVGLDNIRGMMYHDGVVFVSNANDGNNAPGRAVVRIDADRAEITGHFMTQGGSSPWFFLMDGDDILVSTIDTHVIDRYNPDTGEFLGTFYEGFNAGGARFIQQIHRNSEGNILAAGFSAAGGATAGIYEIDSNGNEIGIILSEGGHRGVWELGNRNILWSNSSGVYVYDINTEQSTQVYDGTGRMFGLLSEGEPCIADWNGDGEVDINDFFAYLDDFEAGDPRADLNNDGEIDINDFFIFLDEFEQGC